MKAVSAPLLAALAAGTAVLVTLLRLDFAGGTVAFNTSNWDFTVGGVLYKGAYGIGSINAIVDQGGQLPGLQFAVGRVDSAFLALALDGADQVQGAAVTLSTLVLDSTTYAQLGVLPADWIGYGDRMSITEDGATSSIGMTAESKAVDLLRGNPLVYNDADQQSLVPGDLGFQYVTSQTDQSVVWPTRAYFQK